MEVQETGSFIPYQRPQLTDDELKEQASLFRSQMATRRSVRQFADTDVPRHIIEDVIMTAASAPSGAHKQPWSFCAVSDPELKREIRVAAEKEERINYEQRMSETWLRDLEPFATNWEKPFLEIAPWLIVVFKKPYELTADGQRLKNYYVNESVGLAVGLLIAALHRTGLVTLTHTPSPMNFLERILQRPANERAYLLLPVGFPAPGARVPDLQRKSAGEVISWYEESD